MAEGSCPECGADFETVWRVTVGTNLQGYEPVFGKAPVVVDMGRCNDCTSVSRGSKPGLGRGRATN